MRFPVGYPLLLAPLVAVGHPRDAAELVPAVSLATAVVGYGVALVAGAAVALRVLGKRWLALLALFVWALVPLAIYLCFALFRRDGTLAFNWASITTWATMLSDGPMTVVSLLAVLAFLLAREARGDSSLVWAAAVGALGGFAFLIRYSGVLLLGVLVVGLLLGRCIGAAAVAGLAGALVASPQLFLNASALGSPFATGYGAAGAIPAGGLLGIAYFGDMLHRVAATLGWAIVPLGAACVAVVAAGTAHLRRRGSRGELTIVGWLAVFAGFHVLLYNAWEEAALTRYLMPAYPVMALLLAGAVGWAADRCRMWRVPEPAP